MIKLVIYLLILFHSVVFASYKLISNTPTRLGLDNSAITGTIEKAEIPSPLTTLK